MPTQSTVAEFQKLQDWWTFPGFCMQDPPTFCGTKRELPVKLGDANVVVEMVNPGLGCTLRVGQGVRNNKTWPEMQTASCRNEGRDLKGKKQLIFSLGAQRKVQ